MSEACLKQIRYWSKALKQAYKSIRRKNKYINRLERENMELKQELAINQELLAEKTNEPTH